MTSLGTKHSYRNPVYDGYLADPFVLRWGGGYLAYGTGPVFDGRLFPVLTSPDLATWTSVGGALDAPPASLGTDGWAPEVVFAGDRFWMYYSVGFGDARHHLRVASAQDPHGPFVDTGVNLTVQETFAIDPHPFQDVDGTWYLYYARDVLDDERVGTQLAVDVLTSMTATSGSPRRVLAPSADWQIFERGRSIYGAVYDWHTLEGPTVRLHDGSYYCFYSGGSYLGEGYAVAWARAAHPLGPWVEPADGRGRLLGTVPGRVRGPGHNSIVTTFGDTDMLAYHAWDQAGSKRQMCIDPLVWGPDGPSTPGPSWDECPLPG